MRVLPNSFRGEFIILFIKTHFYGGALTSHFMGEHSPASKHCQSQVRNIFLFGRKLECIARLIYFYIFFEMLSTFLYL